jgi:hypothetical protein
MIAFDFVCFGGLYKHVFASLFTNVCLDSCGLGHLPEVVHDCLLLLV